VFSRRRSKGGLYADPVPAPSPPLAIGALLLAAAWGWTAADSAAVEAGQSSGQTVYVPVYSHIFFGDRGAMFNLARPYPSATPTPPILYG